LEPPLPQKEALPPPVGAKLAPPRVGLPTAAVPVEEGAVLEPIGMGVMVLAAGGGKATTPICELPNVPALLLAAPGVPGDVPKTPLLPMIAPGVPGAVPKRPRLPTLWAGESGGNASKAADSAAARNPGFVRILRE
jgi:hypothetical protein